MKNLGKEASENHIGDLRVAYLENLLTPSEKSAVERHLENCPDCRRELEDLKQWQVILRTHKNSLCPEPWEIFDYLRGAADPEGKIRAHLDECALCRSDAAALAVESRRSGVPSGLWERIADLSSAHGTQTTAPRGESLFSRLAELWSRFFPVPAAAVGAAAVALLLAVLLYPTSRDIQPVVGLSSVQWDIKIMRPGESPRVSKGIALPKDRPAFVILFKGFDEIPSQQRIDSLYRSLKPTAGLLARFSVAAPLEVKQSLVEKEIEAPNRETLLKTLYDDLGTNPIVLLTIRKHPTSFDIEAESSDPTSGRILRSLDVKGVSEADLGAELRSAAFSVLDVK
ncbi:MAG: zf-HC2 domain-containing protein [Desulfomonilaceae bacterium]|nr:zf-HC2 domain-containing protein [Desulfomonilaceae bacterium]